MNGPHADADVVASGTPLADADAAAIALHGRGATARSIVQLGEQASARADGDGMALLAPQAARNTWYPNSFVDAVASNQPHLDSALATVERTVDRAGDAVGHDRVVVFGFSQGACLASEFVARTTRRYGGLAAFSGGRIGPEGTEFDDEGDLEGTPAFLGCSDVDPHIPVERVHETTASLEAMNADVTERIYEGMGHTVNDDEIEELARLFEGVL